MRRFAGQAARHTGRALHHAAQFAFAVVVLTAVGVGALAWRLSTGPLEIPTLAQRLAAAVNAESDAHITLATAALAWEGFREGVDRPLDVRVTQLVVADAAGAPIAAVPRAEVSLSIGWLLLGQLVPRAIEIDDARLHVSRGANGAVTLDVGDDADTATPTAGNGPAGLLSELARPIAGDHAPERHSRWSQLARVRIHDAAISVEDRQLGVKWQVPRLNVDLRRQPQGGVDGHADAALKIGDLSATFAASAAFDGDSRRTRVTARLSPIVPAELARVLAAAAPLALLDAPVGLSATANLDPDLRLTHLAATADIAAGSLHVGQGTMPLLDAKLLAEGTPEQVHVELSRLVTAPRPDGPRTVVRAAADISRAASGAVAATGAVDLDQVDFANLAALWPAGVGGNGTRPWITENITEGTARNGHIDVSLTMPPDLSDAKITHIGGGIDGHDLTVHWLRPVPPVEHAEARLNMLSPDALEVVITAGRQAGGSQGGLQIRAGRVVISGINDKDQYADIEGDLAGPVPDLLSLLRNPKVKLLDKSPVKLSDTAGQIVGKVTLTHMPLRDDVTFDSLQIGTDAKLTGLRLAGIAAGHDLDHGVFTMDANPDGLHAAGSAQVAGIPASIQIDLDFRAGPPGEVLQKVALSGTVDDRQLATLGVHASDIFTGPLGVAGELTTQRDGRGDLTVNADLARTAIKVDRLEYAKPAGQAASLAAHIVLANDQIAAIDSVRVDGDGLHIDGAAEFADGAPSVLKLQKIILGSGTDAHGEVHVPTAPGRPWVVSLAGSSLDASSELKRTGAAPDQSAKPDQSAGPPWQVDAHFERVIAGPDRMANDVALHVEDDGQVIHAASLNGKTQDGSPFHISVEPTEGGRKLDVNTRDAGGLLRLLDIMDTMQGGRMTIGGHFDDRRPDHPLAGVAEIQNFRIRHAPILARLLQAMTLYGLVELAQGPGLGFTKLVAPYRLVGDTLSLSDARAFSASLGMTAKGDIDLARQTADVNGTIVPAYFFNSLLGNIPLVGKLFSPERGGGVFAATYSVRGRLDKPDVGINPLAALTPGFLRGLFGLF